MISNKFALSRFGRSLSFQSCFPEAKSADAKSPEDNDTRISIKCSYNEVYNEDNISPHEVDREISPASHSGKLSVPAVPPEITDLYPSISDSQNSNPGVQVLQIDSNLATVRQVGGSVTHVSLNQSTRQIDPGYPLMSESTDFEAADSFTNFPLATVPYSGGISGEIKGSGRRTYVVLYLAALKGDWEMAEDFLEFNPLALRARITRNSETALHIAAGARHTRFVEELVKLMKPEDLALQNKVGNTTLCFAAASGIRQIAEVMVNKSKTLPSIRGSKGALPLYMAALLGPKDMVLYLYSVTEEEIINEEDRIGLLIAIITANLFGRIKLNTDSSLKGRNNGGFGGLFWDEKGAWISGYYGRMESSTSLGAELWAVYKGLTIILQREMNKVIIETDAEQVVQLLTEELGAKCPFRGIVEDSRIILRGCERTVQHVRRGGNICADNLAKLGANQPLELLIVNEPPDEICNALVADLLYLDGSNEA